MFETEIPVEVGGARVTKVRMDNALVMKCFMVVTPSLWGMSRVYICRFIPSLKHKSKLEPNSLNNILSPAPPV